ncbi:MAG: hypothetical protein ACREXM_04480, partial [Gammaproteobacteria bacterium]
MLICNNVLTCALWYVAMYIEQIPNRKSPPAVLLRESYREGKRVLKRTLANHSWSRGCARCCVEARPSSG